LLLQEYVPPFSSLFEKKSGALLRHKTSAEAESGRLAQNCLFTRFNNLVHMSRQSGSHKEQAKITHFKNVLLLASSDLSPDVKKNSHKASSIKCHMNVVLLKCDYIYFAIFVIGITEM